MSLILRGIDFGSALTASGTRNFFGEGWPQHKLYHALAKVIPGFDFDFTGSTHIAKTTTLDPRMPRPDEKGGKWGNMVLKYLIRRGQATWQPAEFMPDCIKVYFLSGDVLNAVGLTGPGAAALFVTGQWQKANEPFVISYTAMDGSKLSKEEQTEIFMRIFQGYLPDFQAPVALEINDSCPNVEHDKTKSAVGAIDQLKITSALGIPQGVKINVLTSVETIKLLADSGYCDFLDIPNTIPVGQRPDVIPWQKKFGQASPLERYGGGGYSGRENFEMAVERVKEVRAAGIEIPIILGGVSCKKDVRTAKDAGANAISFARLSMTRPWRVKGVIEEANRTLGGKK